MISKFTFKDNDFTLVYDHLGDCDAVIHAFVGEERLFVTHLQILKRYNVFLSFSKVKPFLNDVKHIILSRITDDTTLSSMSSLIYNSIADVEISFTDKIKKGE